MDVEDVEARADGASEHQRRVVINVGGRRYETFLSTLRQYPESLLGTMFSERNMQLLKRDASGVRYIRIVL